MADVTQILSQIEQGDPSASEQLLPLVYDELRTLAAAKMAQEKPGQTLQATGLVHEAYLRLVDADGPTHWNSRRHFFAAAAKAMRNILVDKARRKGRLKRGGDQERLPLEDVELIGAAAPAEDLLALEEALTQLEQENSAQAQIVQLRFFVGLSHEEIAEVLGISDSTVKRHWRYARAWLRQQMHGDKSPDS